MTEIIYGDDEPKSMASLGFPNYTLTKSGIVFNIEAQKEIKGRVRYNLGTRFVRLTNNGKCVEKPIQKWIEALFPETIVVKEVKVKRYPLDDAPKENMKSLSEEGFSNYVIVPDGRVFNIKNKQEVVGYMNKNTGSRTIGLINDSGKREIISYARLVAKMFLDPPNYEHARIGYTDGNKTNMSADNLIWVKPNHDRDGKTIKSGYCARKIDQYDSNWNYIKTFNSHKEAAKSVNSRAHKVDKCCNNPRKGIKGYKWKYNPDVSDYFIEGEEWKVLITDVYPILKVSNKGRIQKDGDYKIYRGYPNSGHRVLSIRNNLKQVVEDAFVHQLVAGAWVPNPNRYTIINHKNGDGLDNNVSNLEWCTYSMNALHAQQTGLIKNRTKPIIRVEKATDTIIEYYNSRAEARKAGYCSGAISNQCGGVVAKGKFQWYNADTAKYKDKLEAYLQQFPVIEPTPKGPELFSETRGQIYKIDVETNERVETYESMADVLKKYPNDKGRIRYSIDTGRATIENFRWERAPYFISEDEVPK
jgi:hypothetical protein